MKYSKSQISIFVVIAVMIIVLLVFLISSQNSARVDTLKQAKKITQSEDNSKLYMLKDNVDFCLQKELTRAVIIAGARGGFIYDEGEYYFPGVLPENAYKNEVLKNLGLNRNYLSSQTLVYSTNWAYPPQLYFNGTIYSRSIRSDMEKFVLNEFLKCIDLDGLRDKGYKVIYDKFSGKVLSVDGTHAKIDGDIGKVGDDVKISYGSTSYTGKIVSVDDNSNKTFAIFSKPLFFDRNLNSVFARNMNSSVRVDVSFQDESVSAKLFFPIILKNKNFETSYEHAQVSVNVRFKSLLNLAKEMIYEKYANNHTINLTNPKIINGIINGTYGNGVDTYFKSSKHMNFKVLKTILNNSDEYKAYVYTIVDNDSKILGEPYVFNFGYENDAPVMNINFLGYSDFFANNKILFITAKNFERDFNLRKITVDKQNVDNYYGIGKNYFYFKPFEYDGQDAHFKLYANGTLKFIGYREKSFNFPVTVTDGETKRKYWFVFLVGFPDNTKNKEAKSCFSFKSAETLQFPVNHKILGDDGTGVGSYVDGSGYEHLFAYTNYVPSLPNLKSKLYFSKACQFNSNLYSVTVKSSPNLNLHYDNGLIEIPQSSEPVKVSVEVRDKGTGDIMTDPFNITIYPARCLGPDKNDLMSFFKTVGATGIGSCCNIAPIVNTMNAPLSNSPKAFVGDNSNLLHSNELAMSTDMYFAFDPTSKMSPVDYSNVNIWDDLHAKTSLYEGTVESKCQGVYPTFESNIAQIASSGSSLSGHMKEYYEGENEFTPSNSVPVNLKEVKPADKCEFSNFDDKADFGFVLDSNDLAYASGFVKLNNIGDVSPKPIPNNVGSDDYSNIFVLCSNKWFGSNDSINWLVNTLVGKGGSPSAVYRSRGYCYQGSTECSGRVNTVDVVPRREYDDKSTCTDWYFDGVKDLKKEFAPSSWIYRQSSDSINCKNSTGGIKSGTVEFTQYCSGTHYGPSPTASCSYTCPPNFPTPVKLPVSCG